MSRPVVGDIRTQKFKRRRNNGDIYVYERTVKYNPNKGYNAGPTHEQAEP